MFKAGPYFCISISVLYVHPSAYYGLGVTLVTAPPKTLGLVVFPGEANGKQMLRKHLQLLCVCEEVGTFGSVENPSVSRIWTIPEIQK